MISLPEYKFKAWSKDLTNMLTTKRTTYAELDTNIGRLTHVSAVLQPILHFISRIRHLKDRSHNRRDIIIPAPVLEDIKLFIKMLAIVHKGISMNLVTYRSPTHLYRSDACPAGIGGYNHKGRAWRWFIPRELQLRATLNFL